MHQCAYILNIKVKVKVTWFFVCVFLSAWYPPAVLSLERGFCLSSYQLLHMSASHVEHDRIGVRAVLFAVRVCRRVNLRASLATWNCSLCSSHVSLTTLAIAAWPTLWLSGLSVFRVNSLCGRPNMLHDGFSPSVRPSAVCPAQGLNSKTKRRRNKICANVSRGRSSRCVRFQRSRVRPRSNMSAQCCQMFLASFLFSWPLYIWYCVHKEMRTMNCQWYCFVS